MSEAFSYERYLNRYGSFTYRCVGTSMLPLLRQDRDLFVLRKKGEARLRPGDVALFRRPPAHYVLHRVVEVSPGAYTFRGDNAVRCECGVTDDEIVGVMSAFVRNGRHHGVNELAYRAYVLLVLHARPLLACHLRAAELLRGIARRVSPRLARG